VFLFYSNLCFLSILTAFFSNTAFWSIYMTVSYKALKNYTLAVEIIAVYFAHCGSEYGTYFPVFRFPTRQSTSSINIKYSLYIYTKNALRGLHFLVCALTGIVLWFRATLDCHSMFLVALEKVWNFFMLDGPTLTTLLWKKFCLHFSHIMFRMCCSLTYYCSPYCCFYWFKD
jgi:hypothetical protein